MLAQHPPEADRLDVNSTLRNSIKKCGVKRKAETGSNGKIENLFYLVTCFSLFGAGYNVLYISDRNVS